MESATNSPRHSTRNKVLSLKRIVWLYPIFRDPHFYHGLLSPASRGSDLARARKVFEWIFFQSPIRPPSARSGSANSFGTSFKRVGISQQPC